MTDYFNWYKEDADRFAKQRDEAIAELERSRAAGHAMIRSVQNLSILLDAMRADLKKLLSESSEAHKSIPVWAEERIREIILAK